MLVCPKCRQPLRQSYIAAGSVHLCRTCTGRAVPIDVLRKAAEPEFLAELRKGVAAQRGRKGRPCPHCAKPMAPADVRDGERTVGLDVCGRCRLVWFDPGEADVVPARPEHAQDDLPGPGQGGPSLSLTGPDRLWKMLPAVLGLPIEYGPNQLRTHPLVTWSIAAALAIVFLLIAIPEGSEGLLRAIYGWGLIPNDWSRSGGLTLLTSFFLHAGWWHLIGNTYFLLIFGDNVEDHLGRGRFVGLLVGAHLAGMALHMVASPESANVPCVGASAGICGVMAYYALAFPRARIGVFLWIWSLFHILRVPAYLGLVAYVAMQLLGAYLSRDGVGGVAYMAHLGGLAVGATAALVSRARQPRRTRRLFAA